MAEPPPQAAALRRKSSMAQVDMLKYRRVFDHFSQQRKGFMMASDLKEASEQLGYRLNAEQIQASISCNVYNSIEATPRFNIHPVCQCIQGPVISQRMTYKYLAIDYKFS